MDTDGDGRLYRGEYYEESEMALIRQAEKVRASIESRREVLIARGDDPDAMIAEIDRNLETMLARCSDFRKAEDAELDAAVDVADAQRNLAMASCRRYLSIKSVYEERLAQVPYDEREKFDFLPAEDRELLRREGW